MSILKGAVLISKEPGHNELGGVLRSLGGYNRNPKELGIPLTSEVLVDFHIMVFIKVFICKN